MAMVLSSSTPGSLRVRRDARPSPFAVPEKMLVCSSMKLSEAGRDPGLPGAVLLHARIAAVRALPALDVLSGSRKRNVACIKAFINKIFVRE